MCGIAGLLSVRGAAPPGSAELARMERALLHRGPDMGGIWLEEGGAVGLAARRLAITGRCADSTQPFHDPASALTLVFNGEIYNTAALRREIASADAEP